MALFYLNIASKIQSLGKNIGTAYYCCGSALGFNADPDPAFYLSADPDPGNLTNADPDPGQTVKSKKLNFYMENIFYVGNRSKTYIRRYKKSLSESLEVRLILKNFGKFPYSRIRSRIPCKDPDPGCQIRADRCGFRTLVLHL
jgi:hypothetical protein